MTQRQSTPVSGPSTHLPALDGVRGLAILLVLIVHLMLFNNDTGNRWLDSIGQLRSLGFLGVDLFFVLSGFLITGILFDTLHDAHYFRNFYMRRFLRIFPLYYGFLFLLLILTPVLHGVWGGRQYVLLGYMQNTGIWFPTDGFHPSDLIDLNHFWSLAVEEQFYLVWPLLIFLIRDRKRLIRLSLILSACALALRIGFSIHETPFQVGLVYEWTLCRMDTLMFGGCLALVLRGEHSLSRRWAAVWFWGSGVVMVGYALTHPRIYLSSAKFIGTFGYTMCAIAFAALIFLSLDPDSRWNRVFSMGWLRSLGKYSYGIYVIHILVGHLLDMWLRDWLGVSLRNFLAPRLHTRVVAILIEFVLNVIVIYGVAYLSYNLYEVRFLRLKRHFRYGRTRAQTASAEQVAAE
ncbi:MAG: acyltransferase family protein [Acidobacteriaceae bacterium]